MHSEIGFDGYTRVMPVCEGDIIEAEDSLQYLFYSIFLIPTSAVQIHLTR